MNDSTAAKVFGLKTNSGSNWTKKPGITPVFKIHRLTISQQ
jgi:hypothetical protein